MDKKIRNKDLASLFEIEDAGMRQVVAAAAGADVANPIGVGVAKTTLPGGGNPGDKTGETCAEYNDELEDTAAVGVGFSD